MDDPPHARPIDDVFDALDTGEAGLSAEAVERRRREYGRNELAADEGRSPLAVFVAQFTSALVVILFAAAAVSLAVGRTVDAVLVTVILLANGVFGFLQEYRAERSLAALREMAAPEVTVRRDGTERRVDATDLVPGDVVVLSGGDVVPADCRLVEAEGVEADEAALTGESVPVAKTTGVVDADAPLAERSNLLFGGTNVTRGRAVAVVVATGMDTEVGAIATALVETEDPRTPLQRDLDALGRRLGLLVVVLSAVVVPALLLGGTSIAEAGLTAISLAVAAVPEGLPAVVTLTLALGVRRMAAENALVRTLPAVEALGSVDVVCTDKTGTLTEGEMRVRAAWVLGETVTPGEGDGVVSGDADGAVTGSAVDGTANWTDTDGNGPATAGGDGARLSRLFEIGAVCSDASADGEDGDPTERALVRAAAEAGLDVEALRARRPRIDAYPFSADRRRMTTVHDDVAFVKGAPGELLDRSSRVLGPEGPVPLDEDTRDRIRAQVDAFASDALRVLAFAYRPVEGVEAAGPGGGPHARPGRSAGEPPPSAAGAGDAGGASDPETDLVFVGLQGLLDPPRPEVAEAIADTRRAGVDVKVITGDNPVTARAIARQVGIDSEVMTGPEIEAADDETLRRRVVEVDVFARAEPGHKVRVLRALQDAGRTVAMTGDGVNDAPALKSADVGIAMGIRGTNVAKGASDLILLDDNYATIRSAIRRGRIVFDNVWKFVAYLLSANAAEVLLVFITSLFGLLVLPAVQLLWINLLTDGLPALALGADPGGDVMAREPRDRDEGVLDGEMRRLIGGAALVSTATMLGVTWLTLDGGPVTPYVVTMVFTGFVLLEFVKLYVVRWTRGTPTLSNPWLAVAVAGSLAAHLAVLYTPLSAFFGTVPLAPADWGLLAGAAAVGGVGLIVVGWLVRRGAASTGSRSAGDAPAHGG